MIDQILQNTSDKIEIDVYYDNVLTNADSITIREIRNPNGSVILTNQTVTAGSTTGRYSYTLASQYTTTLGIYTAIWRFTIGTTIYEHTQSFEVVSSLRIGYITPYEVREKSLYDKITSTDPTDAVLQKYINRSTDIIDMYLGSSINYGIFTEQIRCVLDKIHNGVHIQLKHKPIISLTSVQLMQSPSSTIDLDVDDIRINSEAGYLEYFEDLSQSLSENICIFDTSTSLIVPVATVVYTAGYVTVPDAIKTASVMIVEQLYKETNGDDKQLIRFTIESITEAYSDPKTNEATVNELGMSGSGSIIKLLSPYRQPYKRFIFAGPLG